MYAFGVCFFDDHEFISVPDDFLYDHEKRCYADATTRPEIANTTIEYIATSDYMVSLLLGVRMLLFFVGCNR